jgi:hypothetical protein
MRLRNACAHARRIFARTRARVFFFGRLVSEVVLPVIFLSNSGENNHFRFLSSLFDRTKRRS